MGNKESMAFLPENVTDTHTNSTGISSVWNDSHQAQILGIILSILGSFLISISLNLQKYTHVRLARRQDPLPYYKSKLWWCGVLLMGIGELGNFAAYGFAPATLIAPLGCVAVIGSAAISVLFLKESLRASDVIGGTLAVTGTYLLVTFSPNVSQDITALKVERFVVSWQFLVYMLLEVITFCVLLYLYKRRGVNHIVVLLLLVAMLASVAVISVKAVAGMIAMTFKGEMQLTYAIFYVMAVAMVASCVFQVKFLNQAMQLYNATEVVPINYVFFTTSAILAGDNGYRLTPWLLTPFLNPQSEREVRYNYAHRRTRSQIERVFGQLKSRFRCLDVTGGAMLYHPKLVAKIVLACCILHNIAVNHNLDVEIASDLREPIETVPDVARETSQEGNNRRNEIAQNFFTR